jgi:hypothetical protein
MFEGAMLMGRAQEYKLMGPAHEMRLLDLAHEPMLMGHAAAGPRRLGSWARSMSICLAHGAGPRSLYSWVQLMNRAHEPMHWQCLSLHSWSSG